MKKRFLRHFGRRWFLLAGLAVAAVIWALAVRIHRPGLKTGDVELLVAGNERLHVSKGSFAWVWKQSLKRGGAMSWHPAAFLAKSSLHERADVFVGDFRVTADLELCDMRRLTNLSRTGDGDEDILVTDGRQKVAFATRVGHGYRSLSLIDLVGEPAALTKGWSRWWRIANGITNLQRTGRLEGAHWRHYVFTNPPGELDMRFNKQRLKVVTSAERFEIDASGHTDASGVVFQEMVKARPEFLAWAVDTVRAVPWIGRRKIEWLEKIWFGICDWYARATYDPEEIEEEIMAEQAGPSHQVHSASIVSGWPPLPLEPKLNPSLRGEGQWTAVDDPLFTLDVDGPPLFYRTFFRPDPERRFAPVHIIAWDPAFTELRVMAGVLEPISTTGLRGEGQVPRGEGEAEDHVSRLVAGFNGAFQAMHGEWGMMLDKMVFLPPKPFGATVAMLDNGITAMGTWPRSGEEPAEEIRDFRQNLLPLVEKGEVNPYRLKWWGAVPQGIEERVFTIRTGICLTKDGKIAYFWGEHLSADTLGETMLATDCDYGIHLDMNPGHCGFELYRIDPIGRQPRMDRALLRDVEAAGTVPRRDDLVFRARKLNRKMTHMRFPRYVGRDPRDFFYLLRRKSIFDNPPTESADRRWAPVDSQPAMPVVAVTAKLKNRALVTKIDPGQVRITIEDSGPKDALLAVPFATVHRGIATGLRRGGELIAPIQPGEPAWRIEPGRIIRLEAGRKMLGDDLIQGIPFAVANLIGAHTVVGLDAEGFLVATTGKDVSPKDLFEASESVGAKPAMALLPSGANSEEKHWLVVRPAPVPAWSRIFKEVEPVPPRVWRAVYRARGHLLDRGDDN